MPSRMIALVLAGVWTLSPIASANAQTASALTQQSAEVKLSAALLNKFSPDLRDKAKSLLALLSEEQRQVLLSASDEDLQRYFISMLIPQPKAADFIFTLAESNQKDPSPRVRTQTIGSWRYQAHLRSHPRAKPLLEKIIVSDADTSVALVALESLRAIRTAEMKEMLSARLEVARRFGDQAVVKELAREQERWISLENGTMLPAFLRVVPPQFSLKAADQPVKLVAFGDFGRGTEAQKRVAGAMLEYHRKTPFDFGITLGDNFYGVGMESPTDPRWLTWWEQLYGPLKIKFYATLGNHDWLHPDSPASEILYSWKSPSWCMPSPYYTFTAGPLQFFALDTGLMGQVSEAQLIWLRGELSKSRATWKVVYGHHPIYSAGPHEEINELIAGLLPVLQEGKVAVYLSGHDHNLQHLRPEGGVHFIVSGGGGAGIPPTKEYERTIFKKETHGFAVIEADAKGLKVKFIDKDGQQLYEYEFQKS